MLVAPHDSVTLSLPEAEAQILLGNATELSLPDCSVQSVISSPPYCTRIDYAMATAIELAILRFSGRSFDLLRRSLMGSATVQKGSQRLQESWGKTCLRFLEQLQRHPSKASKTYYYRNHVQYFESLFKSLQEIFRVLEPRGFCALVVQDSYYKELHNDIPRITTEMAENIGLIIKCRNDFAAIPSMVAMNIGARKYLRLRRNTESVLCFERS